MNYNQQSKMKDYEITIVMQVQASDSITEDEVLKEVMQNVPNTPALLNSEKDISLNDVHKSIICLNELSDEVGERTNEKVRRSGRHEARGLPNEAKDEAAASEQTNHQRRCICMAEMHCL